QSDRTRFVLRYTVVQAAWITVRAGLVCPAIPAADHGGTTVTGEPKLVWLILTAVLALLLGIVVSPPVRTVAAKVTGRVRDPKGGRDAKPINIDARLSGSAGPREFGTTLEHGELDHALNTAWSETRANFAGAFQRAI